jgi:hypothetical protein
MMLSQLGKSDILVKSKALVFIEQTLLGMQHWHICILACGVQEKRASIMADSPRDNKGEARLVCRDRQSALHWAFDNNPRKNSNRTGN